MKDSINKFEQSVGGIAKLLTNADLQENVSFAEGDQTFRTVLVETPRDKFDKVLEALKQEYEIDSHNGKNRIFVKIKDHFMGVLPKPKRYKYKGHIIVDVGYSSAPFSIEDYPYAKEFRSLEEAKEFIKKNLCDSEKVNYQPEKRYAVIYVFVNDILKEMHSHVQHTHANYKYFDKPEDAIAAYKRMKGSDLYARLELVYLESGKFWDGENEASYAEWINPVMVEKDVWNKAIDWEEFDKYLELQKSTKDSVSVIPSRKEEIIEEFTDDINDCLVDGGLDYKSFRITNEDKDFYVDFDSNEADAKKAYELLRDGFFKCNLVDDEGFYYVNVIRR